MQFLKNYFRVFFVIYGVLIFTKFLFVWYLGMHFSEYTLEQKIYAIFFGYKFDFATASFLAFLSSLFDFRKKVYVAVTSFLVVAVFLLQLSDIFYFYEANRHIGYEISDALADGSSLLMTALSQHTAMSIFGFVVSVFLFLGSWKFFLYVNSQKLDRYFIAKKLFLVALSVFFIRGMFQHIPLNPWQSNQIGDVKLASIALNDVYNVVFSLSKKNSKLKMADIPKASKAEIIKTMQDLYSQRSIKDDLPLIKSKPNVVFFLLESWTLQYVTPQTAPNFYALKEQGITNPFMVAGGHRTTEGMFSIFASYPNPLGKSVAKTQLQNFKYDSLIYAFDKRGYQSAFFQGTSKETSGTGSFAQSLGFHKSYGKQDVTKRLYETNYWGVHDVDLYNFVKTKIKEPFVIGINGATTHDDKLPKGVKKLHFSDDEKLNNIQNAIHFSDYALGKFINEIEAKYPNTVFVLVADHCGGYISGSLKNYEIPFVIYSKKLLKPKKLDLILSQRDIAPSISDLVLGDYKQLFSGFSGKSLFSDRKFFASFYHNGLEGWIEDKRMIEYNLATDTSSCYTIEGMQKHKQKCDTSYSPLFMHNKSFNYITQKLLFENKISEFKKLRSGEIGF